MSRIVDPGQAKDEAVREWVARQCVDCRNCGGSLFWQPASSKWRHVRGDRIGPTRCRPGSTLEAAPTLTADGQALLDFGGGA